MFHKNEKFSAMTLAGLFHICLGLCFINGVTNSKTSIVPQSIQVTLVAHSSMKKSLDLEENVVEQSTIANLKPVKGREVVEKKSQKNEGNQLKNMQTTGIESDNAKAVSSAITQPVFNAAYLNNPTPQYPQSAKDAGVQGKVLLLVDVSSGGFAKMVQISNSSGYSALDISAKNAVSKWKFVPAMQNGKPVEASVIVPIEFKLS
jgi:TonB family protein